MTDECSAPPYKRNGAEARTNGLTKSYGHSATQGPRNSSWLMRQTDKTPQHYKLTAWTASTAPPCANRPRYVRGAYQFDKFPVRKWSPEHETLVDHLQPKPIMALHLDNTIKMGHEPTHKTYALTKGTPIQVGLEDRTDTLQPEPAKTTIVVECPRETGIWTRDAFMKRINGHQSDIASTIASKDPHNTFRWKCASEHTAGQSGSHAWRLHLPMQLLPRLTQALQTIKQEEENAGNPGPY